MKKILFTIVLVLLQTQSYALTNEKKELCAKIIPVIDHTVSATWIRAIYDQLNEERDNWNYHGKEETFSYKLEPENYKTIEFTWRYEDESLQSISCTFPDKWVLRLINMKDILVSESLKKNHKDLGLGRYIRAMGGLLFQKISFIDQELSPVDLVWYINSSIDYSDVETGAVTALLAKYPFVDINKTTIKTDYTLDTDEQVPLVALTVSNHPDFSDEMRWLLVNNEVRQRIINGDFAGEQFLFPYADSLVSLPNNEDMQVSFNESKIVHLNRLKPFDMSTNSYIDCDGAFGPKACLRVIHNMFYPKLAKFDETENGKLYIKILIKLKDTNFSVNVYSVDKNGLVSLEEKKKVTQPNDIGIPLANHF
ncbi:hypothetical protein H0A36_06250 [Endozoicomonas sp. SM1973]|uniref:Uncharacterized protein n=1 Tax=Spartinivicinus marinus TaxID=2994442 RepID=A0A853I7R9_9GAMM|nr:hypothetical protein [Spartinivicinus marinus]MCX4028272.1 hypothetical protein [Spartinivicinus marinus]NYZ65607.1 hypothetical protein [Spartinivicinus marinus]